MSLRDGEEMALKRPKFGHKNTACTIGKMRSQRIGANEFRTIFSLMCRRFHEGPHFIEMHGNSRFGKLPSGF